MVKDISMHKYIKNKQIVLGILCFISLFLIAGCGKKLGYNINKRENKVIWRTWDAGHFTREKVVQNANAASFKMLPFKPIPGGRKNSFAKDKNTIYWKG